MSTANAHPWVGLDGTGERAIVAAPVRTKVSSAGRRELRRYVSILAVTDATVVVFAVGLALLARFGIDPAALNVLGLTADYWIVGGIVAVVWVLALGAYRTRDPRALGSGATEYRRVTGATAMIFGLLAIVFLLLNVDISRGFFVIAFPVGVVVLVGERWLWRKWLIRQRRAGRLTSATVVVGPTLDVERVIAHLERLPGCAYRPVGVVLDGDGGPHDFTSRERTIPVLGSISTIAETISKYEIDTVMVAGQPAGGGEFIRDLGWDLERTDAELMIASRLANVAGPRIHFRPAEGMPLMHVELPIYEGGKHVVKRVFDIVVSATALFLLWPLFVVIPILIKRDSRGPVFFRQERVGRNGQMFPMVKFRSMVDHAEDRLAELVDQSDGNGMLFKLRDDPRVTKVGRMLRTTSLDELPQLWNVLVGQMSLVGPRPPLPSEVEKYEQHVLRRLYLKPGLTGIWQINGRSNLSWEDSVRLDLYYVENWSLTGDLLILWRTLKVVLRPVGAY
jgi:exopolysaccharide biosynthesis polyprenyl glycosylphosphotransferase